MPELSDAPPPYGTVVFDCDSTLSAIEGVEEISDEHEDEIVAMTAAAMAGEVPLEEVYGRRLELVRPDRARLEAVGRRYVEEALPHARELVAALQGLGKRVAVVSGGLLPAVLPFARWLGIAPEDVHAVDVRFDAAGAYADFDRASPLARSGGKPVVLRRLAAAPGAGALALVGDGATDLEAAGEVARFVAFGGVERRETVFAAARVACEARDLAGLLPHLLAPAELAALEAQPAHAALLGAGRALS